MRFRDDRWRRFRFEPLRVFSNAVGVMSLFLGAIGCREPESTVSLERPKKGLSLSDHLVRPEGSKRDLVGGIVFRDVAEKIGLVHVWPTKPRPMRTHEAFGCGCGVIDFDRDGWSDILLVADPHPRLFRNDQGRRFVDVTHSSGLQNGDGINWTGVAVGDFDGDGWLDLLLTGLHRLALYRNRHGQTFEDVTESAGLDVQNRNHWGASAGFADLDGDRWLDLVILNYVEYHAGSKEYCELKPGIKSGCPPKEYPPEKGELWRNTGRGSFELIPADRGMGSTTGPGLVLAFSDVDEDGRPDIYIGNDGQPAELLHNLGDMKFENRGIASGLAFGRDLTAMAAMGADWGDFDRDGRLDLAISNFDLLSFSLFRHQEGLFFQDLASSTGLTRLTITRLGFGTNWLDFDNDGWVDLAFVNGHVYDNAHEIDERSTYRQPTLLLRNENGRKFTDLVPVMTEDVRRLLVGRGSASLDFDNDGRMDFLAVDFEGPAVLLRNDSKTTNHWLKLDLRGAAPNVRAYGARVVGRSGKDIWVSEVTATASYLSSKEPRIHWGLGAHSRLDSLTIHWPSGQAEQLKDIAADQILTVNEVKALP